MGIQRVSLFRIDNNLTTSFFFFLFFTEVMILLILYVIPEVECRIIPGTGIQVILLLIILKPIGHYSVTANIFSDRFFFFFQ